MITLLLLVGADERIAAKNISQALSKSIAIQVFELVNGPMNLELLRAKIDDCRQIAFVHGDSDPNPNINFAMGAVIASGKPYWGFLLYPRRGAAKGALSLMPKNRWLPTSCLHRGRIKVSSTKAAKNDA